MELTPCETFHCIAGTLGRRSMMQAGRNGGNGHGTSWNIHTKSSDVRMFQFWIQKGNHPPATSSVQG